MKECQIKPTLLSVPNHQIDDLYWPDEVASKKIIYPYVCKLADKPFMDVRDTIFPYIDKYN